MKTVTQVKKTIMRRVYYSYALSLSEHTMFRQGLVLGACIALFGRLTHVAAIIRNFEATRVADAPSFVFNSIMNAMTHGEVLTVLVVLFIAGISISFTVRAVSLLLPHRLAV